MATKKSTLSNVEKFKAIGFSESEAQRLDLQGFDFTKVINFVVGLIELYKKTFGGGSGGGSGGNGNPFSAAKALVDKDEKDRLKGVGVPAKAAALGGGRLIEIIRLVLSLLGGLAGR